MGRKRQCPPPLRRHPCARLALRDARLRCAKPSPHGEAPVVSPSGAGVQPNYHRRLIVLASPDRSIRRGPPMKNPYLFDLARSKPLVDKKKSGTVRGAYEKNFPVVRDRAGAMFLVILD